MELKIKVEMPCGYECDITMNTGFFEMAKGGIDGKLPICPLHGKECKRK